MARSPKVTTKTTTTSKEVKPLKPILKETSPSTSMAIVTKATSVRQSPLDGRTKLPPGGEPRQSRNRESPPGGGPKRPPGGEPRTATKKQVHPPGGGPKEDDIDEGIYYTLFEETVQKELPKVDSEYTVEFLQEDIVCIIADIFETYNYLVIPDQDMLQKIATNKITDNKLRNDFIFGKEGGMHDSKLSCHEKIKEYSKFIRKNAWDNIIDKYSKMEV